MDLENKLHTSKFLVTGGAGFIGSNLVNTLIQNGAQKVIVLDNLSTGFKRNISHLEGNAAFEFVYGDIRDYELCLKISRDVDFISHQAALGSVPRSLKDPFSTNDVNITGFLNILMAAKENKVRRVVYAASSSTYGDSLTLPKKEDQIGMPLSPYAVTKYANELYAHVFGVNYGVQTIGLRYFNVFGPHQNPEGEYAAVIPLFIQSLIKGITPVINGDGNQSRDFTYIDNAIQANLKALLTENPGAINQVYNIAVGESCSINEMFGILRDISGRTTGAIYREERKGDVRDSLADISKAREQLQYEPEVNLAEGLKHTYDWFLSHQRFLMEQP